MKSSRGRLSVIIVLVAVILVLLAGMAILATAVASSGITQLTALVVLVGAIGISLLALLLVSSKFLQLRSADYQFLIAAVLILLAFVTIPLILFMPNPPITSTFPNGTTVTHPSLTQQDKLSTFTSVMAIVGVWVGAVVAFYFGSENLRNATQSLVEATAGPRQILENLKVHEKMRDIPVKAKMTDNVGVVELEMSHAKDSGHSPWFVVVVKADGSFETVANEELFDELREQYLLDNKNDTAGAVSGKVNALLISEAIDWGKKNQAHLLGPKMFVPARTNETLSDVQKRIDARQVYLAIVLDDMDRPIGYLTTSDIRQALLGLRREKE